MWNKDFVVFSCCFSCVCRFVVHPVHHSSELQCCSHFMLIINIFFEGVLLCIAVHCTKRNEQLLYTVEPVHQAALF